MMEKIRAWLTLALLAFACVLLFRLTEAVEDVALAVEDTCASPDSEPESEDSPAAQVAHAPAGSIVSLVARLVR